MSDKAFYLPPDNDDLTNDFINGEKIADKCDISDISKLWVWMRGYNQCLTGWANSGKTVFAMYMMVIKSIFSHWKWCIWSPEEITSFKDENGNMTRSAKFIYNRLIHIYTGKVPYKSWKERYGLNQMTLEEYLEAKSWVEYHFKVIDTGDDDTPDNICEGINRTFGDYGIDGYLIDPFKNIDLPNDTTTDKVMERVFKQFEKVSVRNDLVGLHIAHPRNMDEEKKHVKGKIDGPYRWVTSSMLLGGSAWENSMDIINSWNRQEMHLDPKSPKGSLATFKMRNQELTGEKGLYDRIHFDYYRHRFLFNMIDPILGEYMGGPKQNEIKFEKPFSKKKQEVDFNSNEAPF